MNSLRRALVLGALAAGVGCQERVAEEELDFETLKVESCESMCVTIEACDPEALEFNPEGMWPEDCFERCMVGAPLLHEQNQCGSHTMRWMRCFGALDCDGYAAFQAGNNTAVGEAVDYAAPCVSEFRAACSLDEPFDLDDVPPLP